jgi:hypothetical protein
MPCQGYPDGLYLVKQKSPNKGVDHYGIVDIGNRSHIQNSFGFFSRPTVIHQAPPKLRADWFETTGMWTVLGKITDETMARQRLKEAAANPAYDLFGNNCEHFARFIATGKRESTQLQGVVALACLAVVAVVALNA